MNIEYETEVTIEVGAEDYEDTYDLPVRYRCYYEHGDGVSINKIDVKTNGAWHELWDEVFEDQTLYNYLDIWFEDHRDQVYEYCRDEYFDTIKSHREVARA